MTPQEHEQATTAALRTAFAELRDLWFDAATPKRNGRHLAERLEVQQNSLSYWATGSDPTKRPPLWALAAMAEDLGKDLRIAEGGARIEIVRKQRKPAASDAGTPA